MATPSFTPAKTGQALFLAGPSSSGKSSVAKALQEVLSEPWVFLPADRVSSGYPKLRKEFVTLELDRRLRYATMLATRSFLDAGLNVIAEQGLWDEWALPIAASVFSHYRAFVVQLQCDVIVREAREAQREEIRQGFTRWQETNERWTFPCDLLVNTEHEPAEAVARTVAAWLNASPTPTAFLRIRAESEGADSSVDVPDLRPPCSA